MTAKLTHRRMSENEVVFRKFNETIDAGFAHLRQVAHEDGQEKSLDITDDPLLFYCECSDENCRQRISIRPSKYTQIHQNRSRFIIMNGHDSPPIEKVVLRRDSYAIVEKYVPPETTAEKLQPTPIDNTP